LTLLAWFLVYLIDYTGMNLSQAKKLQVLFLCISCAFFAGCTVKEDLGKQPSPNPSPIVIESSPIPSVVPLQSPTEQSTGIVKELKAVNEGTMYEYTSTVQNLHFTYVSPKQGAMHVLESGNTICVTYDLNDHDCVKGQSVEVFTKTEKETLPVAITSQLLKDIPKTKCFTESLTGGKYSKPKTTFVFAQINFPNKATNDDPFSLSTAKNCPEKYRAMNGIRYFAMDKKHPDKFFFFNIGQYAISSGEKDQTWDETVRFIDAE
jgi:hypothetical protein